MREWASHQVTELQTKSKATMLRKKVRRTAWETATVPSACHVWSGAPRGSAVGQLCALVPGSFPILLSAKPACNSFCHCRGNR